MELNCLGQKLKETEEKLKKWQEFFKFNHKSADGFEGKLPSQKLNTLKRNKEKTSF